MTCQVCGGPLPGPADRCPRCSPDVAPLVATNVSTSVSTSPALDATFISAPGTPPEAPTPVDSGSDTGPLNLGQTFGPRYHILKVLGVGGMGAVYQAYDQELGVAVAIKVIRPEVMANAAVAQELERRFKRELLLAREVTHKNVVRIHDLGEIGGIKYITMSYVNGVDLASLIRQEGRLSVERALAITRSIVEGLSAAHAAGVVHRDLKPGNIMVRADGEALIMDFGIARSTAAPDALAGIGSMPLPADLLQHAAMTRISEGTNAGAIVGTIQYMAPEQARGEEVDSRADVYALGLILYDMLAGRHRSTLADSATAELDLRMKAAPALPHITPLVPAPVARVIERCLQPEADKRYPSTQALAADLDRLDAAGELKPVRRVFGLPLVAAVVIAFTAVTVGLWWYLSSLVPPPEHAPVAVVIADVQNTTGDASFDRALEPIIKLSLEQAGFINAHDRSQIRRNLGVQPPELLNAQAARELALQQGLGVVVAGTLERQGRGYRLALSAVEAVTGNVIAEIDDNAAGKEQVLATAAGLAGDVREALGGEPSDSAQRFAMETLSATSLDVVRRYALAIESLSDGKLDESRQNFSEAVRLDPDFGLAYAGMGMTLRNLGQQGDAEYYVRESLKHLDGMTERERYRTRGIFYTVTADYQACVKEYGELIARYASDASARSNRALCSTYLRDISGALVEMKRVVEILPRRALYRVNLALYAAYSSDFMTGEQEARNAVDLGSSLGLLPLAFSQLGQNQRPQAADSYTKLGAASAVGKSFAASGLGDLAVFEGRYREAERLLQEGANADAASGSADRAAAKLVALAQSQVFRGQPATAVATARRALAASQAMKIKVMAGRVFIAAGRPEEAAPLIAQLTTEVRVEPQAYAKLLDGEAKLQDGDARGAIPVLTEANTMLDTWLGRFALGRAYLAVGEYIRADSEFDACLTRQGEALSLFLDEEPTYGYLPEVYYYQGRVREALQSARFTEPYRTYLNIRGAAGEDPLLPDVRRRIASGAPAP